MTVQQKTKFSYPDQLPTSPHFIFSLSMSHSFFELDADRCYLPTLQRGGFSIGPYEDYPPAKRARVICVQRHAAFPRVRKMTSLPQLTSHQPARAFIPATNDVDHMKDTASDDGHSDATLDATNVSSDHEGEETPSSTTSTPDRAVTPKLPSAPSADLRRRASWSRIKRSASAKP